MARPGIGHNGGPPLDDAKTVAGDKLKSFVDRIERLEAEKATLAEDIKEVYAEAKGNGFDPKIMRMVVRRRKMERQARDEQDELLELYEGVFS